MRAFPTPYPNEPKICSVCGVTVARKDCHKNRYGKYICRNCQAAGVKPTRRQKLLFGTKRAVWGAWVVLAVLVVLGALGWIGYALLEHLDTFKFFRPLFVGEGPAPLRDAT